MADCKAAESAKRKGTNMKNVKDFGVGSPIESDLYCEICKADCLHADDDRTLDYSDDDDDDCTHTDKRVCEMLGHANYSEDGQSGPY